MTWLKNWGRQRESRQCIWKRSSKVTIIPGRLPYVAIYCYLLPSTDHGRQRSRPSTWGLRWSCKMMARLENLPVFRRLWNHKNHHPLGYVILMSHTHIYIIYIHIHIHIHIYIYYIHIIYIYIMSAKMAHVWSQMIHNYPMIRLNQRWSWQDDRAGRKGRRPRPSDEYHAESLHQGRILQDLPWFSWWIHIPSHSKGSYGSTSSTHKKWRIHCDFLSRCEVDAGVTPLLTP